MPSHHDRCAIGPPGDESQPLDSVGQRPAESTPHPLGSVSWPPSRAHVDVACVACWLAAQSDTTARTALPRETEMQRILQRRNLPDARAFAGPAVAVALSMLALAGCGGGDSSSAVRVAQARVSAKEKAVTDAKTELADT